MSSTLDRALATLTEGGFSATTTTADLPSLVFENDTVVGFVLSYSRVTDLVQGWAKDSNAVMRDYRIGLRAAGSKAWNCYLILLADNEPTQLETSLLSAIEEDLVGTRKIVRGECASEAAVRRALMPLLPLQSSPALGAVDMAREIRNRTTELSAQAVRAFLSDADLHIVHQILEEGT